jgi:hypothetical protein
MKSCLKAKENEDSQYYRFRSRIIDIQDIFKEHVPSLSDMDTEGNGVLENEEKLEQELFRITVSLHIWFFFMDVLVSLCILMLNYLSFHMYAHVYIFIIFLY